MFWSIIWKYTRMKIHTYENSSGKDLIKKYIDKLSKEEQVDGYSVLQACRKQKNKTETTDKNIVISRAKELGKLLNKSFI